MNSNTIAKLLAKENLTVQVGSFDTASFDVEKRVLNLPDWSGEDKNVHSLLVGHEVGHALYTPADALGSDDAKALPHAYINVVEDNRIERLIQIEYPGLVRSFNTGYKSLFDADFFGELKDANWASKKLIDKINIRSKVGGHVDIPFNDDEEQLYNMVNSAKTFEDVLEAVQAIMEYAQDNPPEEEDKPDESNDDSSGDSDGQGSQQQSQNGPEGEDDQDQPDSNDEGEGEGDGEEEQAEDESSGGSSSESASDDEASEEEASDEEGTNQAGNNAPDFTSDTDDAFQSNLNDMSEALAADTVFINDTAHRNWVIPFSELDEKASSPSGRHAESIIRDAHGSTYDDFIKKVKKEAMIAVREFEQHKAAFETKYSSTHRTGRIDTNALHKYKLTDDIFLTSTRLAQGKNHGMVMLIDFSSSMHQIMDETIAQTIYNAMFCKMANIPFEVYTFTTQMCRDNVGQRDGEEYENLVPGDLTSGAALATRLTSDMSKSTFEKALFRLWTLGLPYYYLNRTGRIHRGYDLMGGTPLVEAYAHCYHIINKFKRKHNVEKAVFTVLSDGAGFKPEIKGDHNYSRSIMSVKFKVLLGRNIANLKFVTQEQFQSDLIKAISELTNCTNIGFFLCPTTSYSRRALTDFLADKEIYETFAKNDKEFKEFDAYKVRNYKYAARNNEDIAETVKALNKVLNKKGCVEVDDYPGFDYYYVINIAKLTNSAAEEDLSDAIESRSKALTGFKKYSAAKNKRRTLLQKFGKAVAL